MNLPTSNIARDAVPAIGHASNEMLQGARDAAHASRDDASRALDKAQQSLSRYASATTHYVAEQPMRSVLIAAAVGAAVALLVASSRQRRNR